MSRTLYNIVSSWSSFNLYYTITLKSIHKEPLVTDKENFPSRKQIPSVAENWNEVPMLVAMKKTVLKRSKAHE